MDDVPRAKGGARSAMGSGSNEKVRPTSSRKSLQMSDRKMQRDIIDLAKETCGARITMATTNHVKYPATNIIDGVYNSFWASGGLFPEQFVISLTAPANIDSIKIRCYNVKTILVERCTTVKPGTFEEVVEKELESETGRAQDDTLSTEQITACHLRFTIKDGYDPFCAVYQVKANGSISDGSAELNTNLSSFKNQFTGGGNTKLTSPISVSSGESINDGMSRDQTPFPFVPKEGGGYTQRRRPPTAQTVEEAPATHSQSNVERLPPSRRQSSEQLDSF